MRVPLAACGRRPSPDRARPLPWSAAPWSAVLSSCRQTQRAPHGWIEPSTDRHPFARLPGPRKQKPFFVQVKLQPTCEAYHDTLMRLHKLMAGESHQRIFHQRHPALCSGIVAIPIETIRVKSCNRDETISADGSCKEIQDRRNGNIFDLSLSPAHVGPTKLLCHIARAVGAKKFELHGAPPIQACDEDGSSERDVSGRKNTLQFSTVSTTVSCILCCAYCTVTPFITTVVNCSTLLWR